MVIPDEMILKIYCSQKSNHREAKMEAVPCKRTLPIWSASLSVSVLVAKPSISPLKSPLTPFVARLIATGSSLVEEADASVGGGLVGRSIDGGVNCSLFWRSFRFEEFKTGKEVFNSGVNAGFLPLFFPAFELS